MLSEISDFIKKKIVPTVVLNITHAATSAEDVMNKNCSSQRCEAP